jgi:nicotinamidase-related amidase
METAYGPNIPRTLKEVCHPRRTALLVYDMQAGIVSQLPHGPEVTARVAEVLWAAREGGFPVFLPPHVPSEGVDGTLPDEAGDGLAAGGPSLGGRAVVPARLPAVPDRARARAAAERGCLRQDRHERLLGDLT